MTNETEPPIVPATPISPSADLGEVDLTLSDIEAGLASLPRAKIARAVSVGGALLVAAMVAYRWHEGRDRTTLAMVGVAVLVLLFVNRNPARKIAKRVFDALPLDARKIAIKVDESGLLLRSSGADSKIPWSDIWKLVETNEVIVVFLNRENAQILPKRALSESQLSLLRTLSKQKVVVRHEPFFTPELYKRLLVWSSIFAIAWVVWFFFGQK